MTEITLYTNVDNIELLSRVKSTGCIWSSLYAYEECLLKCVKQNVKCYSFWEGFHSKELLPALGDDGL